jgi:hypothetical protein
MRQRNSNFDRRGCFKCCECGKLTRATGLDNESANMCPCCYEVSCWENSVSDNDLSDAEAKEGRAALDKKYGRTE